ncbi:hypothetical protein [Pseudonocardia xishanensis]|uniref:Mce-associated membrane protein n=1 Tax=Pseudonocardia xishanensis TaxID=630995 RepID=A0ABP8RUB6_9PSEU
MSEKTEKDIDGENPVGMPDPVASTSSREEPAAPRRSRGMVAALGVALVALVVGATFGGMLLHQRSLETARAEAREAASLAAQQLLSYDYRSLDRDVDLRLDQLTGDFRERYRSMVAGTVAPAAAAQQVVTTSTVVGSSVVAVPDVDHVTLLLFLNQSSEAPSLAQPLLTGSRVQLSLERVDGRWLTADIQPV